MSLSNIQECQVGMETMPEAWAKKILNIKFKNQYIQGTKHVLNVVQGVHLYVPTCQLSSSVWA